MVYYYIYKITCTKKEHSLNNHYYFGKRQTKKLPEYDNYTGSGKLIKEYLKENPYDYEKQILYTCSSLEELNIKEEQIINEHINDALCLNLFRGGLGGDTYSNMSDETKATRTKNVSLSNTGKKKRVRSEQHRINLSNSLKGIVKDAEWRRKISEAKKNKKLSDEHRLAISKGSHHTNPHEWTDEQRLHLSLKQKEIMSSTDVRNKISESVKKTMQSEDIRKKCREGGLHTKGLIWVSNKHETKRVLEKELEYYFNIGYHRGRKKF